MKRTPSRLAAAPADTRPQLSRDAFDAINKADLAYYRLAGFATVLERFAQLHEEGVITGTVDFGTVRESHFWCGLRLMARDIAEAATTIQGTQSLLREAHGIEHTAEERTLLATYRGQDINGRKALEMWARLMDRLQPGERKGGPR
jgi:hypothetical protein